MYARIENNAVVQWPIPNIQQLFPNTSFPSTIADADLPEGYVTVGVIAPPQVAVNQKLVPSAPINNGGKWVQGWDVVDLTNEEVTERDGVKASDVRSQRNRLLSESDWTQVADAPVVNKAAWVAYRQELRDITNQPGFPYNINWPQQPNN